jgi:biotin transport system substrate-specific component
LNNELHSSWRYTNLNSVQEGTDLKLELRDYSRIGIFVGIIAVLGLFPKLPIGPVPFSIQVIGVFLAGAVLGSYRGTLAVLVFEVLVLAGAPLLTGLRGGLEVFFGPTFGFLIGWLIAAWVIGLLVERTKKVQIAVSSSIGFILAIGIWWTLGLGYIYLASQYNLIPGAAEALAVTLPVTSTLIIWDFAKLVVSVLVLVGIKAAYPKALSN